MPEEITLLPVREFPDRGTKWLLESPENTNCLLRIVDINLAECIDFKRLQHIPTTFIPDNLRKQEADVIFLAPFKDLNENTDQEEFAEALRLAVSNLDKLPEEDRNQWEKLMWYLVLLIFHRRDTEEQSELISLVDETTKDRNRREEVSKMGRTAAQALMEEGRELGLLQARQEALLDFIHSKFGSVPQKIEQQIQAIRDLNRLRELTRRVPKANSVDEINIE